MLHLFLVSLPFTDVDYRVYTDASKHVLEGHSPFERHTFRYTPVLAWLLTPCITVHFMFGKFLFCFANVGVGYVIEKILLHRKCAPRSALGLAALWLFHPIPLSVSARGNADSLICFLVVLTILCLLRHKLVSCGIALGLAVHLKVYPALFALPVCVYLASEERAIWNKSKTASISFLQRLLNWVGICRNSVIVGVTALGVFGGLTAICYYFYGYEFLFETYLYHISRKDNRHNFSPLFLIIYLTFDQAASSVLALAAFIPQIVCAIAVGIYFAPKRFEVACFLQVLLFVAFNKVCTAQYFLWWQSILPLVLFSVAPSHFSSLRSPSNNEEVIKGEKKNVRSCCKECAIDPFKTLLGKYSPSSSPMWWCAGLMIVWQVAQALWLLFGYQVEMQGLPSFVPMFHASVIFLATNLALALYALSLTCTCDLVEEAVKPVVAAKEDAKTDVGAISSTSRSKNVIRPTSATGSQATVQARKSV